MGTREANDGDRGTVFLFLKPDAECLLCANSDLAFAVNRDWLDGRQYEEIVQAHLEDYRQIENEPLTPTVLAMHFNRHMDARGAAINKWSRGAAQRRQTAAGAQQAGAQQDLACSGAPPSLYDMLSQHGTVDKPEAANRTIREIIVNLDAMRTDIKERKDNNRTFDLVFVLKEYGKLLQGLHGSLLKSQELDSKLEIDASTIQSARILDFVMLRTLCQMDADDPRYDAFVRSAEQLWFSVAARHIVLRLDAALRSTELDPPTRASVLMQVKKAMKGLDVSVVQDYDRELGGLRESQSRVPQSDRIIDGVAEPMSPQDSTEDQTGKDGKE